MHGELTKNNFFAEFQVECECSCGNGFRFAIEKEPDDVTPDMWAMSTTCKWESLQRWSRFIEKMKLIWKILTGKEFYFHSIILHTRDILALRDWLNTYTQPEPIDQQPLSKIKNKTMAEDGTQIIFD